MFKLVTVALLLGLSGYACHPDRGIVAGVADTGFVIEGTVDNVDAMPVGDAQVSIDGTAFGTLTDSLGRFSFTTLPPTVYGIVIRKAGYRPVRCDFVLELKAKRAVCNVRLNERVDSLAEPQIIN
jgi:hypothetical protein